MVSKTLGLLKKTRAHQFCWGEHLFWSCRDSCLAIYILREYPVSWIFVKRKFNTFKLWYCKSRPILSKQFVQLRQNDTLGYFPLLWDIDNDIFYYLCASIKALVIIVFIKIPIVATLSRDYRRKFCDKNSYLLSKSQIIRLNIADFATFYVLNRLIGLFFFKKIKGVTPQIVYSAKGYTLYIILERSSLWESLLIIELWIRIIIIQYH